MRPRTVCRRCGKTVSIRRDGRIHAHKEPRGYGGYYMGNLCPGTGARAILPQ